MTAHKHAALMLQYAQDAAETDKPWDRWEFFSRGVKEWKPLGTHPIFYEVAEYRRKPQTIKIGEVEVPKPMIEMPEMGSTVWVVALTADRFVSEIAYTGCTACLSQWLKRGLCHTTKEAALQHANALIAISGGETC